MQTFTKLCLVGCLLQGLYEMAVGPVFSCLLLILIDFRNKLGLNFKYCMLWKFSWPESW